MPSHNVKKEVLAVIPARGGSKGIPRKNLIPFRGAPLISHTITHALESHVVNRVIVSTDDDEIATVAKAYGAEVPFMRPAALAEDHVLDLPVFEHALAELERTDNYVPDLVVHLRPTAPYRQSAWVDKAVEMLATCDNADSVRSVSPPVQHPYRMFRIDPEGFLAPIMGHEHATPYLLRRQDLPTMYYYNCVIDVTRPRTIRARASMTGARILPYVMNPDDVIDIDSKRDLAIANALFGGSP